MKKEKFSIKKKFYDCIKEDMSYGFSYDFAKKNAYQMLQNYLYVKYRCKDKQIVRLSSLTQIY